MVAAAETLDAVAVRAKIAAHVRCILDWKATMNKCHRLNCSAGPEAYALTAKHYAAISALLRQKSLSPSLSDKGLMARMRYRSREYKRLARQQNHTKRQVAECGKKRICKF